MNRWHIVWAIFWIGVAFAGGCAQDVSKPLTPEEELRLHARVMAENICGTESKGSECHRRAMRWYYKLSGMSVDEEGWVRASKYCRDRGVK